MSEGREVKTPNFLCCIANIRGAEIWSGVRLVFNLIFLVASSVYVSVAKVHNTKKAAIKVNINTFQCQDIHPLHSNSSPEVVKTCTALAVQFGLSLVFDGLLLLSLKKKHLRLLCAGMVWILLGVLLLLVSVFNVEQMNEAVLFIMASLGLQLWSFLIYFGAYQDLKHPPYLEDITLAME